MTLDKVRMSVFKSRNYKLNQGITSACLIPQDTKKHNIGNARLIAVWVVCKKWAKLMSFQYNDSQLAIFN